MIVLDSNVLIHLIRKKDSAIKVLENLGQEILATTRINQYEILLGFHKNRHLSKNLENKEEVKKQIENVFKQFLILEFTMESCMQASEILGSLMIKGEDIGDKEAMIAGIMLSHGCTKIVTNNIKHFNRIKRIETINY